MPHETITIPTTHGTVLAGTLELPAGEVRGVALFAHCFTCTQSSRAAVAITRDLAKEGFAALRFDFTGLGKSSGNFAEAGFTTDIADVVCCADYLSDRYGLPLLLIGHSLGGAAVLAATPQLGERVAAVATLGAPADVPHVLKTIKGDLAAIEETGEGPVTIGGRPFNLSRDFLERTGSVDLEAAVAQLGRPLLLLHSPVDEIVGIENASKLYLAARHPKSFVSLDHAGHLLLDPCDAEFAARMIAAWSTRYLQRPAQEALPQKGVVVATGHDKFGTEIYAGRHAFIADEPASYGGENAGPTPYDLLLAALGSCTAMTMKMYADKKGWPFPGTRIHLTHERDHVADCEDCIAEEQGMTGQALIRNIALLGEALDAEQRAKLIAIADKCPVHRTLEGHLAIITRDAAAPD